ncbi:uncharacterized protein LOC135100464 [Scylla paramamosain]|uniref:uncharacterized protein LOC135100464 n=1 Tax=Scylla paramamosain TaxID=85552 RepID=UPI003083DFE8
MFLWNHREKTNTRVACVSSASTQNISQQGNESWINISCKAHLTRIRRPDKAGLPLLHNTTPMFLIFKQSCQTRCRTSHQDLQEVEQAANLVQLRAGQAIHYMQLMSGVQFVVT